MLNTNAARTARKPAPKAPRTTKAAPIGCRYLAAQAERAAEAARWAPVLIARAR